MKRLFKPDQVKTIAHQLGETQSLPQDLLGQITAILADYLDIVTAVPEPALVWEEAIDSACEYLADEEADHLYAENPYKENTND